LACWWSFSARGLRLSDGVLAPTCRQSCITIARYYDPATAQFLTVDPKVATTLSPYGYAKGDPLNLGDPLGLGVACDEGGNCGSPHDYATTCGGNGCGSPITDTSMSPCAQPATTQPSSEVSDFGVTGSLEPTWLRLFGGIEDVSWGIAAVGGGVVMIGAGVAMAPETFGLSLVMVPLGLGMSAGGAVLTWIGFQELTGNG